jgi:phage baseplate assembly protein V
MTQQYRAQSLDRRLFGVCSALVEDNDDPDKEGRVTLRFPWLDDATVTDWCRVMQPYAGDGYGAIFVPEKHTEVLVAFVHGDMNEAIVLGGLYNGKDKPPASHNGTKRDVKMIKTKAGHTVRLDDSAKSRAIELKTVGGHDVVLDDQNKKITIKSAGGHSLVLDDNGSKIELTAKGGHGKLTIESSGKITIKGTTVTVDATAVNLGG